MRLNDGKLKNCIWPDSKPTAHKHAAKHCYSFHMWPVCLHSFISTVKLQGSERGQKMIMNKSIMTVLDTLNFIIFNSNTSKSLLAIHLFDKENSFQSHWLIQHLSLCLTDTVFHLRPVSASDLQAPWLLRMQKLSSVLSVSELHTETQHHWLTDFSAGVIILCLTVQCFALWKDSEGITYSTYAFPSNLRGIGWFPSLSSSFCAPRDQKLTPIIFLFSSPLFKAVFIIIITLKID